MKVLITGMTSKQVGKGRTSWITFADVLPFILTKMGYTCYKRAVIPGEDLSYFDKVIVFIAPHDSIAAGYRWSGLWALASRPDAIVAVDDWQYFTIQPKIRTALAAGRFFRFVDELPEWSRVEEVDAITSKPWVRSKILDVAHRMVHDMPFEHILIPLFKWYIESKIGFELSDKSKIVPIDPSNFIKMRKVEYDYKTLGKEKQWVIGSLFDHSNYVRNLNLKWPLKKFGHKKTQTVLSEPMLCEEYAKSFGIISPKYKTSGDGWWRMRYVHSAHLECFLLMNYEEATAMHKAFYYPPHQVESMSNKDLDYVRLWQCNWLATNFEKKDSVEQKIEEIL